MAEYEDNKFLVLKVEDVMRLEKEDRERLNMLLYRIGSNRENQGKNPDPKYYACNQDEPYAIDVLDVILRGEERKERARERSKTVVSREGEVMPGISSAEEAMKDAAARFSESLTPSLDAIQVEVDPLGKLANQPGAKLDAGKNRLSLVLGGFADSLWDVGSVGTFGAKKYTDNGWKEVPDAKSRYLDAMYRHLLKHEKGEFLDADSGLPHLAHAAWNVLAVLQLTKNESGEITE